MDEYGLNSSLYHPNYLFAICKLKHKLWGRDSEPRGYPSFDEFNLDNCTISHTQLFYSLF